MQVAACAVPNEADSAGSISSPAASAAATTPSTADTFTQKLQPTSAAHEQNKTTLEVVRRPAKTANAQQANMIKKSEAAVPEETLQWGCELYKETIRRWQQKCKELDPYIMATEQRVSSSSQVAGSRDGPQGGKLSKLAESAVLEQEAAWWRDRFRALQSRASAPGKAVMGKAGPPGQHTGATKVSILFTSA